MINEEVSNLKNRKGLRLEVRIYIKSSVSFPINRVLEKMHMKSWMNQVSLNLFRGLFPFHLLDTKSEYYATPLKVNVARRSCITAYMIRANLMLYKSKLLFPAVKEQKAFHSLYSCDLSESLSVGLRRCSGWLSFCKNTTTF